MSKRRKTSPLLLLLLLVAVCFSMSTVLQTRVITWTPRHDTDNAWKIILGDGRRLFANHFFVQADITFHSGYYPSIFDQGAAPKDSRHLTRRDEHDHDQDHEHEHGDEHASHEEAGHDHDHSAEEHERQMDFLGPPRDWIEAFGRRFMITDHTHLAEGQEREMLPWLKISAELDPQRVETYIVSAYWLRSRLGKVKEAEAFLREGLRHNPTSYQILFELGRLYYENHKDTDRARNLWEMALARWNAQERQKAQPDLLALDEIAANLAALEEKAGRLDQAIRYLELAKTGSPNPEALQRRIEEIRSQFSAHSTPR